MPVPNEHLDAFRRWALGNLVENRNRGLFAEWLVGTALGVVSPEEPRKEWDVADFRYRDLLIEVKASGRSQTWSQTKASVTRFDIAARAQGWHAASNTFETADPPRRFADAYVFCLHRPNEATNENVADPDEWTFWVTPTRVLDSELGAQKSVGLGRLSDLAEPVSFRDLRSEIDRELGLRGDASR
jgi:hypothetical protein